MSVIDRLRKFLESHDKTPQINTSISTNRQTASSQEFATGQTGEITAKGRSQLLIDNSTTNNFMISLKDIDDLPDGMKQELKQELLKQFAEKKIQFINKESNEEITAYNEFEKHSPAKDVIDFYHGKIPAEDLQLLRTGLYVKDLQKTNRKKALRVKERATARGGRRARNIINLATAGYFENYIKAIFTHNTIDDAKNEYEEAVEYMPEIIFVHKAMSTDDIVKSIEEKIAQKEKYHLQVEQIRVNGLGKTCTINIQDAIRIITERYPDYNIQTNTKTLHDNMKQCKARITGL